VTKTRPIYEAAVQHVPDARIKDMCLKFAELELVPPNPTPDTQILIPEI